MKLTEETPYPVGVPDAFERLWTPHRMVYLAGENKPINSDCGQCPFCYAPTQPDGQSLIIGRGQNCYVVLNLYPYNPGHLLVCPNRHVPRYVDLTAEERAEFGEITAKAIRVLESVSQPDGMNLGMNQGGVAGAGIAAHLHQHIVPRWQGDANFFPIIAQTKALPQLLGETRELLAKGWQEC